MVPFLQWLWNHLEIIAGVLLIPWGMFVFSLALVGWNKFSETSGADVYIILTSLDLEFIVFRERFVNLVYGGIQSKFNAVFAIGFIVSLIFLALSSRVQRRIAECRISPDQGYPSGRLFACWAFALPWMAAHFFAILAK
jgi:hypothetical protein